MTREDELIQKIKQGKKEALDELIEQYYPAILRYCLWHMPDRESAQDAAQETFLKMIRHLNRYEPRGQFRAFLYRIAANTCVDMKRGEARTEEMSGEYSCPEYGYQAAEQRQMIRAALLALKEEERELVLLRYGQELTLREIADLTGISLRTVQSRLRKAAEKLRKELEK